MKLLPLKPSLEYLRREAKALKASHKQQDSSVCEAIAHFDISFHGLSQADILASRFSLLDAQRVVARQYGFSSWARLKWFVNRSQTPVSAPEFREQLLVHNQTLNALLWEHKSGKSSNENLINQIYTKGLGAHRILAPVFERYGWPGPDVVGQDGMEACFCLVSNAVLDSNLQLKAANLMEESLSQGKVSGRYYVPIIDRWLALSGRPTLFGTTPGFNSEGRLQFSSIVEEPANLDKRRAKMGYESFEKQTEIYISNAKREGLDLYPDQKEWFNYRDNLAVKGGYKTVGDLLT